MIRLNLLPHREQKRQKARRDFHMKSGLSVLSGGIMVVMASVLLDMRIAHQRNVNQLIAAESSKLDVQIREVATLTQEITALTARQNAVENLQSDRNQSVYLMEELVRQVPDGIYLYEIIQEEKNVTIHGYTQANEYVSEFMRNIDTRARWIGAPQLQEIKAVTRTRIQHAAPLFDFTITAELITAHALTDSHPDNASNTDDTDDDANVDAVDPPPELKDTFEETGNRSKQADTP